MRHAGLRPQYDRQNFFYLTAIQSAALGFSMISIGKLFAAQFGAGTAICSIIVGNLILWLIAISMISMVDKVHSSAIDNVKAYFGRWGGILAAGILVFAFLNWYSFQLSSSLEIVHQLLGVHKASHIRIGAACGLFCALLSIGGIRFLRTISAIGFPLIICYYLYALATSDRTVVVSGTWGISHSAVLATILNFLPGVINFQTFFRHSRSKGHSFFALSWIAVLVTLFEISTIWIGFEFSPNLSLRIFLAVSFVLFIMTTCNLVNIYLASACWETIVPRFGGAKGFAILGLCGTLTYTFIQITPPVQFLQDVTNAYIGNLGVVLLMAFLMRIVNKRRLKQIEKRVNLATWLFGCAAATLYQVQHDDQGVQSFIVGVNASILFYLVVIFIEEAVWALRVKRDGFKKVRKEDL